MNPRAIASIVGILSSAVSVRYGLAGSKSVSNIGANEHAVLFTSNSWIDSQSGTCYIPINGWVYKRSERRIVRALFGELLQRKYGLSRSAETEENFKHRTSLLTADEEQGKRIVIKLLGKRYAIENSASNGHFATTIEVDAASVQQFAGQSIPFELVLRPSDSRRFKGQSLLIGEQGVSVISDIDDTVKLSYVTDHKKLFESSFFNDFLPVEGMSDLYRKWEQSGARFHYVSSSPWQLYEPLVDFMNAHDFPNATLSLKQVRFKDETFFNLFKSATKTKPQAIEAILKIYPNRKFILLGDSGEKDAEVYASIARNHEPQIAKIYIRNIDGSADLNARYEPVFEGVSKSKWQTFKSPAEIDPDLKSVLSH